MRKTVLFLTVLAVTAAGCGGGQAACETIVDDGIALFQDVIDDMDGLTLADLGSDLFESPDYEDRAADLERRTTAEQCADEEMAELFAEKLPELTAADTNPGGQFLISFFNSAVQNGEFSFGS